MANELRISDATGLTYTCQVKEPESGGSVIGTVSLSEDGSTGDYYGTFPAASAGYYDLKYIEDSIVRRAETAYWTGSALLGDANFITATGFSTHSASDVVDAITASSATIAITSPFNAVTNSLDIIIGETLDFTITRSFSASWEYIEFVIKDRIDSPVGDDDAILKATAYADATPGGLIVLNKQAVVGGTSDAVITADQPNSTTRIKVLDGITYQLTKAAKLYFTVRWVDSGSDSQSVSGQAQAGYVAAAGGDA